MRLPSTELEGTGSGNDGGRQNRYGARQRRLLHCGRSQRHAQRIDSQSERRPYGEISDACERNQPGRARSTDP